MIKIKNIFFNRPNFSLSLSLSLSLSNQLPPFIAHPHHYHHSLYHSSPPSLTNPLDLVDLLRPSYFLSLKQQHSASIGLEPGLAWMGDSHRKRRIGFSYLVLAVGIGLWWVGVVVVVILANGCWLWRWWFCG